MSHTSGASHVAEAAQAAWSDALAWFDKYLKRQAGPGVQRCGITMKFGRPSAWNSRPATVAR